MRLSLVAGVLWAFPAMVMAVCDQQTASQKFQAARGTQELVQRTVLLEQSLRACPTFLGHYLLGESLIELKRFSQAKASLEAARRATDSVRHDAHALGRLGEVYFHLGDLVTARLMLDRAYRQFVDQQLNRPEWLNEIRIAVDDRLTSRVLSADEITMSFATARNFTVEGPVSVDLRVHFAFDSDQLEVEGLAQVHELGLALSAAIEGTQRWVEVIGHADLRGSDEHNQDLSERRAKSVLRRLEEAFPVLQGRLQSSGRGRREPRYQGQSEAAHRFNRRVEVRLDQ